MQAVIPTALLEAKILSEYAAGERFKWGDPDEEEYADLGDYDYFQYEEERETEGLR